MSTQPMAFGSQPLGVRQGPPDPDPGYRNGALIDAQRPTVDIINGMRVVGTERVKVLKNAKIRYANPIKPMKTDPSRVFGYAYARIKPGRFGCIGITGFDNLAPVVAGLRTGQVVSFMGQVNYREGRAFFEVTELAQIGGQPQAEAPAPVAAAPAPAADKPKRTRKKATAAPAAPVTAVDDSTLGDPNEPTF